MCVYIYVYMRKFSHTVFPLTILLKTENSWGKEVEGWREVKACFLIMLAKPNDRHNEHGISDSPQGTIVINTVDRPLRGLEKMIKTL